MVVKYAAALAGLTVVTVNPSYQKRELHYVLQQSTSAGLFLFSEFRGNSMGKIAAEVAEDLPALREVCPSSEHLAQFAE